MTHYSDDCEFDLHPGSRAGPVLIFVHGGAWRAEDKAMHADLARRLAAASGCPVAVPNYRLTPADNTDPKWRHPIHAGDVLAFLNFIRGHPGVDADNLVLIGHSCSAHMLAAIALQSAEPALVPAPAVLAAIRGIVCSEGIFDLDALLVRFPDYRAWFIAPAFGPGPDYAQYNAAAWPLRDGGARIEWLLLHSHEDTLVDVAQAELMHAHLTALDPARTVLELDTVTGDHDDVLASEAYVARVCAFVARFS
ncbi:hypothetical protein HYPSUDRAFT_177701 [Hypholoma sublateritium FD-334 SS-4]|uniref:Alpha/beta hydrolase fold-3 domain-containing protein n=1 Tax=Hypholoma sublateritium (strain FD-334 SS-4) TaxID=945553 RepID=A0A0D2LL16_HYPSF|nr:hypothetical protein HYPSUDRAFT_177701 [Hypholoma sublateritium FD-334 SS-4]